MNEKQTHIHRSTLPPLLSAEFKQQSKRKYAASTVLPHVTPIHCSHHTDVDTNPREDIAEES